MEGSGQWIKRHLLPLSIEPVHVISITARYTPLPFSSQHCHAG
jgi:hypothetical protein